MELCADQRTAVESTVDGLAQVVSIKATGARGDQETRVPESTLHLVGEGKSRQSRWDALKRARKVCGVGVEYDVGFYKETDVDVAVARNSVGVPGGRPVETGPMYQRGIYRVEGYRQHRPMMTSA